MPTSSCRVPLAVVLLALAASGAVADTEPKTLNVQVPPAKMTTGAHGLQEPMNFPTISVYSTDGIEWDWVDQSKTLTFSLRAQGECKGTYTFKYLKIWGGGIGKSDSAVEGHHEFDWRTLSVQTPFQTPLESAIEACNYERQNRIVKGESESMVMSSGHAVVLQKAYTPAVTAACSGVSLSFHDPLSVRRSVSAWVRCEPFGKKGKPANGAGAPTPQRVRTEPQRVPAAPVRVRSATVHTPGKGVVSDLKVEVSPTSYQGKCPRDVTVRAWVTVSEDMTVAWRVAGEEEYSSPSYTVNWHKGVNSLFWKRSVSPEAGPQAYATGSEASSYAEHKGYFQVRLSKVAGGKIRPLLNSKKIDYVVKCGPPQPKIVAPGPGPSPPDPPVESEAATGTGMPDVTLLDAVRVGPTTTRWGRQIALSGTEGSGEGGLCGYLMRFRVKNDGAATSAIDLRVSGVGVKEFTESLPPLGIGATRAVTTKIWLTPGQVNEVRAHLDPDDAVFESDEQNNQARLRIQLGDSCPPQ